MCSSEGMADGGESVRLKLKNKKVSKELVVANPLSQKNGSKSVVETIVFI